MRKAIIIGAGPAGLTAAYELLSRTDIVPIVLEAGDAVGGLCRTVRYRGNRMDLGGHRFFSKSPRVHAFWQEFLPLQGGLDWADLMNGLVLDEIAHRQPQPDWTDLVMMVRKRCSRIFYGRRFFDYPVSLNMETVKGLGLVRTARIGASFAVAQARKRPEQSLEDFLINRFGEELYRTFFADYTEKVWGVAPALIPPDWGAQRIKGVSVTAVLAHALKQATGIGPGSAETSLAEQFGYPKYGPGQFWDAVADEVRRRGGEVRTNVRVDGFVVDGETIIAVRGQAPDGPVEFHADVVMSSMPVDDLVAGLPYAPAAVCEVAEGLMFRDFVTVGVLARKLRIGTGHIPDQWIYVQEPDVKVGRLQVFNNWSPYLLADPARTVWLGLEYFCSPGDALSTMDDAGLKELASTELEAMGMLRRTDVLDRCVVRAPRAYPAYFGSYSRFGTLRDYLDGFENLFLIGRNGQHRYNNMDHSMLTAMLTVDHLATGRPERRALWEVNSEAVHHESGDERASP